MIKSIFVAALLGVFSLLAQPLLAEPYQLDSQGVVQEVDLSAGMVTISGYGYAVEPGAKVRVAGYASSLAALNEGMKVQFVYKVYEGLDAEVSATKNRNVLIEVVQLPDSTFIEEF